MIILIEVRDNNGNVIAGAVAIDARFKPGMSVVITDSEGNAYMTMIDGMPAITRTDKP
jgi:hypothetical protein